MTRHPALRWRVAIVLGLIAVVAWMSRNLWFIDDDWDYLTNRTGGDIDSYLQPHAGHWTLWTVPVFRALYRVFGMDYFPWYHLPRFLACAVLALLLWKAFERRGASPIAALAATCVFVVLDTSAGHRSISIGSYIVLAALIVVGLRLAEPGHPSIRDEVIVGIALLFAVAAFSTGPVLLFSFLVVAVCSRRLRDWWRAVLVPLLVFGWWTLAYSPDRSKEFSAGDLPQVPQAMLEVLSHSASSLLGLPTAVGAIASLAVIGLVAWWAKAGKLDRFDALAIVTTVTFLVLTAALRVVADFPVEDRYAFLPIVATALVLVPRIPQAEDAKRTTLIVGLVAAALFAVNLVGTHDRSQELAQVAAERRVRVESAAALLVDGEPAIEDSWVTVPLTVEGLRRLVDDGWHPTMHPEAEQEARGLLRIGLGPDSIVAPSTELPEDCQDLDQGDEAEFTIDGPTVLVAVAAPPTQIVVTWTEGDDVGTRTITWAAGRGAFHGRQGRFAIAGPQGDEAELSVLVQRTRVPVTLCTTEP